MNLSTSELLVHLWPRAGALVVIADQMSKALVVARSGSPQSQHGLRPRIVVRLNWRTGIAGVPRRYVCLLLIIAFSGSFAAVQMLPSTSLQSAELFLTLALAGAIGNLFDLVRRGAIVDFIDLRIWPVFNLADACIVAGTGGLLWLII